MKKFITACAAGALALVPDMSFCAISACFATMMCPAGETCMEYVLEDANCIMSTQTYYDIYGIHSCSSCKSGYVKTAKTISVPGCSNDITYYICQEECKGCSNCTSDTTWSSGNTGYQKKATRTCNCNTCNTTWSYRCAAGYYGSSSNGTSGCTRCPSSGGVYGTSAAGSTAITSCYLPSGTIGTDSTGTWTYTQNCYYSN